MNKEIFLLKSLIFILCLSLSSTASSDTFSQIAEAQNVLDRTQMGWTNTPFATTMKISGYVKAEGIYDSRQVFAIRDGHFLFYPLNRRPDVLGRDINSRGDFGEYAIQTRLRFEAFGPDIGCMQSRSYIEGDFFGMTNDTIDAFRMRHAYLELESDEFNFLAGQTWHPMYIPVESPDTISFNTGTPINPYTRDPQFRILYHNDYLDILGAAIGFLDFRPLGPLGESNTYFRDAIMPNLHLQARLKWDEAQNYIGAGVDVMRICPRLVTNLNYKEVNPFTAFSAIVYSRFAFLEDFIMYSKFTYAQNASMWAMIGGYAVHSVDPLTDIRTYTPLRTLSFWSELIKEGDVEPALFIGYVKNLGAKKTIIQSIGDESTVYGLGTDIKTVFRVSPRIRWYLESFVVGVEIEYTRAAYGFLNQFAQVIDAHPIGNTRFLFATYYIF